MIIDTSALVALLRLEIGHDAIGNAMTQGGGVVPSPVLVEYHRVTKLKANAIDPNAAALIDWCIRAGNALVPLDEGAARAAVAANSIYGKGSGHAAKLNMLDLMVYGIAKTTGLPILCTGRDFTATDAAIHPASRSV